MIEQSSIAFQSFLDLFGQSGPPRAAAIFGVAIATAAIIDVLCSRVIGSWTKRTATDLDDRLIALLHRPLFLSALLVGLRYALIEIGPNGSVPAIVQRITLTLIILVWLNFAVRASSVLLEGLSRLKTKHAVVEPQVLALFQNAAKVVLISGAIYYLLLFWGVDVGPWLASAGIMGLAIGLAAKDSLANLFSGIFILADAPYKVGDFINLDSGERGEVTQIGMRSTRMLTRDDMEITVPNAVIGNAKILNESGGPWAKERVRVKVGVAYGSDVDLVRSVLLDVAAHNPALAKDPEPRVRFRSFGESSLDFELLGWIDEPVLRGRVLDALNTAVYKQFQQANIEIPYPKRDLYIREMPGSDKSD